MRRGTTPTFTFTLPFSAEPITLLSIMFEQGETKLEKDLADCTITGKDITVELSEAETLGFSADANSHVEIQLRVGIEDKRYASEVMRVAVDRILKDGALT